MAHPPVTVREATQDDVAPLLEMWRELRDMSARMDRVTPCPDEAGVRERIAAVASNPGARMLVAVLDDEVAGMTVLTDSTYAPLFDHRAVHAHYLHVRSGFRHRGVGKALLAAAVSYADEVGAEHVLTSVLPQMRETQRFYARLGFGPVVVRRSVPVSVLRRRLAASGSTTVAEHLVARRRTLRRVRAAVARVGD